MIKKVKQKKYFSNRPSFLGNPVPPQLARAEVEKEGSFFSFLFGDPGLISNLSLRAIRMSFSMMLVVFLISPLYLRCRLVKKKYDVVFKCRQLCSTYVEFLN